MVSPELRRSSAPGRWIERKGEKGDNLLRWKRTTSFFAEKVECPLFPPPNPAPPPAAVNSYVWCPRNSATPPREPACPPLGRPIARPPDPGGGLAAVPTRGRIPTVVPGGNPTPRQPGAGLPPARSISYPPNQPEWRNGTRAGFKSEVGERARIVVSRLESVTSECVNARFRLVFGAVLPCFLRFPGTNRDRVGPTILGGKRNAHHL